MEAISDFIVTSKLSGLFVMPIIVFLVYALLFKSKKAYLTKHFFSLHPNAGFLKVSDT